MTETNQVIHGDCMDVLAGMEDNCISTIITDPPYHLGSISKRFTKTSLGDDNDTAANARNGSNQYARLSTGFMGKSWDGGGIAFQPELWAEMLRVAKPGAMLLAFGGTRTHHRLMVAIEDAGWEIRDCLMWLYGSGFPKSHNISKAIDKHAGEEREVVGKSNRHNGRAFGSGAGDPDYGTYKGGVPNITAPATEAAKTFDGYGTGLKPAYEPIIYAQKPIEKNYANNAQVWGVAGLNIDGARVGTDTVRTHGIRNGTGDSLELSNYKSPEGYTGNVHNGRWPANVLLSHSEGCVRRGERKVKGHRHGGNVSGWSKGKGGATGNEGWQRDAHKNYESFDPDKTCYTDPNGLETVSDWECVDRCAVRLLDEQSGESKSSPVGFSKAINGNAGHEGYNRPCLEKESYKNPSQLSSNYTDSGGASRFFYTAKAPNREKWFYCQLCQAAYPNAERDNHGHDIPQDQRKHIVAHPTVKPLEILKYFCTLTKTPTGGIVLDPFAGSGTTALACIETGRDFILIEKEADYYEIAKARVEAAMNEPRQAELF